MPEKRTRDRAPEDAREGKSPSTQAAEFVKEEFDHIREGKHGARSAKQAVAIGLSKARRAGVKLPPPKGTASAETKRKAAQDSSASPQAAPAAKRSRATSAALKREGHQAGSKAAISRQARSAAASRTAASRSASARKAARTRAANR